MTATIPETTVEAWAAAHREHGRRHAESGATGAELNLLRYLEHHPVCEVCKELPAVTVFSRRPRARDVWKNLYSACLPCHDAVAHHPAGVGFTFTPRRSLMGRRARKPCEICAAPAVTTVVATPRPPRHLCKACWLQPAHTTPKPAARPAVGQA